MAPHLEYRPYCGLLTLCLSTPGKSEKIKISSFEMGLGVWHLSLFSKRIKS